MAIRLRSPLENCETYKYAIFQFVLFSLSLSKSNSHITKILLVPLMINNNLKPDSFSFQSSSCLSDKEEDIYDLAAKYESNERPRFFGSPATMQKMKLSPPG